MRRPERERPRHDHRAGRFREIAPVANLAQYLLFQAWRLELARHHRHLADGTVGEDLVANHDHAVQASVVAQLVVVGPAQAREVALRSLPDRRVATTLA